jgi:hypothetical protein
MRKLTDRSQADVPPAIQLSRRKRCWRFPRADVRQSSANFGPGARMVVQYLFPRIGLRRLAAAASQAL